MTYYHDDDGSDEAFENALLFWTVVVLAGIVGMCVLLQWITGG